MTRWWVGGLALFPQLVRPDGNYVPAFLALVSTAANLRTGHWPDTWAAADTDHLHPFRDSRQDEHPLDTHSRLSLCRDWGHPSTPRPLHLYQVSLVSHLDHQDAASMLTFSELTILVFLYKDVEQGVQVSVLARIGESADLLFLRIGEKKIH